MSERNYAPGKEFHGDNNGSRNQRYSKPSRNLTWRRDPLARDHTTRFPNAIDPAESSVATNPGARHPYGVGARESPQYDPGPVYPRNAYVAYGVRSYGYGTHVHPSHGYGPHYPHNSRDRYPHSYGSREYYPPHGWSPHYPIQGIATSGPPPYGVRAHGHLSQSHGVSARSLPSHGKGVHGLPTFETGATVPVPKFPAVCLRGLPRNCREVDVIRFFDRLDIVDVFFVFINKNFARKAFVVFANAVAADSALQRDKQKLGYESVEISTCRRHDYYDAVAAAVNDGIEYGNHLESKDNNVIDDVDYNEGSRGQAVRFKDSSVVSHTRKRKSDSVAGSVLRGHPDAQPENLADKDQGKPTRHILKVRGPCFVDKKVLVGAFDECNLCEDRIHNVFHPDGKPTGEILLEFLSEEDAKKAMSKDKTMIESHLIEIIPCPEDLQIANTETEQRQEIDSRGGVNDSHDKEVVGPDTQSHGKPRSDNDKHRNVYTQVLKLGNVPPSADMYDIIEFFGEFNLTLDRLQVVCRRDGIATGEVYVEFDSVEDSKKAISKDKKMILSQHVELFPSSPNEASRGMSRYR